MVSPFSPSHDVKTWRPSVAGHTELHNLRSQTPATGLGCGGHTIASLHTFPCKLEVTPDITPFVPTCPLRPCWLLVVNGQESLLLPAPQVHSGLKWAEAPLLQAVEPSHIYPGQELPTYKPLSGQRERLPVSFEMRHPSPPRFFVSSWPFLSALCALPLHTVIS